MRKTVKKTIKITLITVCTLVLLALAGIAIAINFIFTPEKLTPTVVKIANSSLQAHVDLKSVELTFFSSFPKFGLVIDGGTLTSKAIHPEQWNRQDSLLSFKRCAIVINPIDYLLHKRINLRYIGLEDASLYAYRNEEGKTNWDLMVPSATTADTLPAAMAEDSLGGNDIHEIIINKISLKNTDITLDDRNTHIFANMYHGNLDFKASLNKRRSMLELAFSNKNILFWQNGQLLVNHVHTDLNTQMDWNREDHSLTLKETRISVNGVEFDLTGTLQRDSSANYIHTDLQYSLHAPSLETVLHMIPESVLQRQSVKAKGDVRLDGSLKGRYGEGQIPLAQMEIQIKDAALKYKEMPYGIDDIDLDFKAYIDLMHQTPSYADLKIFRFEGAHTTILASAKADDLLKDPYITLHLDSKVDLTALAKTFPLQEGVSIEGGIDANLDLQCRLSSLKKQDIGRIRLKGQAVLKETAVIDTKKDFRFGGNATFNFTGQDVLAADLTVNDLQLTSPGIRSSIQKMKATIQSSNPQDTTSIVKANCSLQLDKISGEAGDSIRIYGGKTRAELELRPREEDATLPALKVKLDADTLYTRLNGVKAGMDKGIITLSVEKLRDSVWKPGGVIAFAHLMARTPSLALPVELQKTAVTISDKKIMLRNAQMNIGKSDLVATGAIHDLFNSIRHHKVIRAEMELTSKKLDCNQLLNALIQTKDEMEMAADTATSEAPMELFVIPANIDFTLQTNLSQVNYGKMLFENVKGTVRVNNQSIYLQDLSMRGLDADMKATLVYQAKEKAKGYTGFDFKLKEVNIGKLVDFIPALDTIVPMLRSFKGIVNFDATAEASLDSTMNIQIPSLRSAVHIKGDSLVLMDGETFAEISKMMMFKNKKRNLIDSIYVNLTVENGDVTIYPFIVQIDRYKVAVGGKQGLDMNFNYHISVLHSPVPFKLGVNITGNLDKMKFRIGKCKYKDDVTPVAIRKVDSTRINLGKTIKQDFERMLNKSTW